MIGRLASTYNRFAPVDLDAAPCSLTGTLYKPALQAAVFTMRHNEEFQIILGVTSDCTSSKHVTASH